MNYKEVDRIQHEGWDAYDKGMKESECPYKSKSPEARAWVEGYLDSKICNNNEDGDD